MGEIPIGDGMPNSPELAQGVAQLRMGLCAGDADQLVPHLSLSHTQRLPCSCKFIDRLRCFEELRLESRELVTSGE